MIARAISILVVVLGFGGAMVVVTSIGLDAASIGDRPTAVCCAVAVLGLSMMCGLVVSGLRPRPRGKHDDQVDAIRHALWQRRTPRNGGPHAGL